MLLQLNRLTVPPGCRILFHDISWREFEEILEDLGENRAARIAYDNGILEIMTPLAEHEADKVLIGDLLKALLEELDIEFWSLGSTTFKNQYMLKGIEPDDCFYIENEALIRGKKRLDLTIDHPPDLALEIDLTSRSYPKIYEALGVPQLWQFEGGKLKFKVLQEGKYIDSEFSLHFPNLPLREVIPSYLNQCGILGRNKTMKVFRQWVRENSEQL